MMPGLTLFPPLELPDEGGKVSENRSGVLPTEIKAKFDTIRAIQEAQKHNQVAGGGTKSSAEQARKLEVINQKLAAETAVAVEEEMSRLAKGIAELEELLVSGERDAEGSDPMNSSFPSLPAIIPDDTVDIVSPEEYM